MTDKVWPFGLQLHLWLKQCNLLHPTHSRIVYKTMKASPMVTLESLSGIGLPSTRSMVMLGGGLALRLMLIVASSSSAEAVEGFNEMGSFPEIHTRRQGLLYIYITVGILIIVIRSSDSYHCAHACKPLAHMYAYTHTYSTCTQSYLQTDTLWWLQLHCMHNI